MTFSTSKRKIFKLWNDSIENGFLISKLSSNDGIILSEVNELNTTDFVYKNVLNLSSPWITPKIIPFSSDEESSPIQYAEYEIILNGIHKNLIPYIESKIAYRVGDSVPSSPIPVRNTGSPTQDGTPFDEENNFELQLNEIVEIKDILAESRRNVSYKTSIIIEEDNDVPLTSEFQFKFYIQLVNPNYYQST